MSDTRDHTSRDNYPSFELLLESGELLLQILDIPPQLRHFRLQLG